MKTRTFTEEEIFKIIDDYPNWFYEIDDPFFDKDYSEDELLNKLMSMLKDKFRTPQGFRRAIKRAGLIGTKFGCSTKGVKENE